MILTETLTINGKNFVRTYSDLGMQILQVETGRIYDEAVDIEGAPYTYVEYEEPTDDPEDIVPTFPEGEAQPMTRAELTAKVNELDEAINMILSGVTE